MRTQISVSPENKVQLDKISEAHGLDSLDRVITYLLEKYNRDHESERDYLIEDINQLKEKFDSSLDQSNQVLFDAFPALVRASDAGKIGIFESLISRIKENMAPQPGVVKDGENEQGGQVDAGVDKTSAA